MMNEDDFKKIKGYNGNILLKGANQEIEWTPALVKEFIKCTNSPVYFIEKYMKIVNVNKGLTNFKLYPYQHEMIESFAENRFTVCCTARQAGKSVTVCGFILWYVLFHKDKTVALLANKGDTAREILGKIRQAYQHLPKWLQQGVAEWNKGSLELENNSRVIATSTSSDNIRGFTINLLFIDEAAFIDNWDTFFTSVYPTISSGDETKVILVSTPNGMNHFYSVWANAMEGKNNYNPIKVTWQEVPGRDLKWKEDTLSALNFDVEKFAQEYEVEFLGSSGTLIAGWKLKELVHQTALVVKDGLTQYVPPENNHVYMMVCDVSRGKGLDYSAFQVVDVTKMPYQQICVYRSNNITPMDYAEIIHRTAKGYNDAAVLVEVNDIGEQVSHSLHYDFGYENVLFTENAGRSGKRITGGFGGGNVDKGIRTTKIVKSVGCSILKLLIEQNQLIINDFNTINELSTFSKKGASYEAEPNKHDDLVMCLHRTTKVETEDGTKTIKWVVDNKYHGKVLSFDETNKKLIWKSIVGHISRPNKNKKWVKVKTFLGRNKKNLLCTSDHKVAYIDNIMNISSINYIEASELVNKYVIKNSFNYNINPLFNKEQLSVSIGILMGDGHVNKNGCFSTAHGEKQNDYSKYIHSILGGKLSYNKKNQTTVQFNNNGHTHKFRELFYENGKKTIKNILNYIDDISLAFWYMDDGYLKLSKGCVNYSIELCTDSFSKEDHILLQNMFKNKFNIKTTIIKLKPNKYRKNEHYRLRIGTKDSISFFNLISPYICDNMKYKLPTVYHNTKKTNINNKHLDFGSSKVIEVVDIPNNRYYQSKLYDIQIEDTHNFIADDVIVHNCLVLFAWISEQQYFKDYTNINTLLSLREKSEEDMEQDMAPFGFVIDGRVEYDETSERLEPSNWMFQPNENF